MTAERYAPDSGSTGKPVPKPLPRMNEPTSLPLASILLTGNTQCRASLDSEYIEHLAEKWSDGAKIPPVTVFHDGTTHWLADGFHRYHAAQKCDFKDILADVRSGTVKDAITFALGANDTNGRQRTNADKRKAVEIAVAEFPNLSSREIAKMCAVSHTFTEGVRPFFTLATVATGSASRSGSDGRRVANRTPPGKETKKNKAAPTPLPDIVNEQYEAAKAVKGEGKQREAGTKAALLKVLSRYFPTHVGALIDRPATVQDIYKAYPRHKQPTAAYKAIESAMKKEKLTADALLEITLKYAAAIALWPEADLQFVPYPASWFNAGSFLEDPKEWQRDRKAAPKQGAHDL